MQRSSIFHCFFLTILHSGQPKLHSFGHSECNKVIYNRVIFLKERHYSKTCLKQTLKNEDQKLVFKTGYRLMQVSLRPLFCLFLSGPLRQVLRQVYLMLTSMFYRNCKNQIPNNQRFSKTNLSKRINNIFNISNLQQTS